MDGYEPLSNILTWRDSAADFVVSQNDTFSLQYWEGCCGNSSSDNAGISCADVYFEYGTIPNFLPHFPYVLHHISLTHMMCATEFPFNDFSTTDEPLNDEPSNQKLSTEAIVAIAVVSGTLILCGILIGVSFVCRKPSDEDENRTQEIEELLDDRIGRVALTEKEHFQVREELDNKIGRFALPERVHRQMAKEMERSDSIGLEADSRALFDL